MRTDQSLHELFSSERYAVIDSIKGFAPQDSLSDLLGCTEPVTQIGTNLAVALDLAQRGFKVFPCKEAGAPKVVKSPYTSNGMNAATTNSEQIRNWWHDWPGAIVGLPCRANGLAVLDLDRHRPDQDGIAALHSIGYDPHAMSPFTVKTAGDGLHLYFKARDGLGDSDTHLPGGINVKCSGYVIAPGSVMRDGRKYTAATSLFVDRLHFFPAELMPPKRNDSDLSRLLGDVSQVDWNEVQRALAFISPDCSRDEWVRVGMALHAASDGSEEAFGLWNTWSAQASEPGKYQATIMRGQWRSFARRHGIDIGTLFHIAGEYGWIRGPDISADDFDDLDRPGDLSDLLGDGLPHSPLFEQASAWASTPAKAREWLVEDLIPNGVVTMLNGDGGTGKSLLALQLAVATAEGGRWIGREIDRPGKTIFLSAEDSKDELHRRLESICGDRLASLDRLLISSLVDGDPLLATFDKHNTIRTTKLYAHLERVMEREQPSLVVLDTLADLHTGDENNRSHARQFIGKLKGLAGRFNCAVLLLAHPSRSGMADGSGASGSTGWNNSVRSRLYLKRVVDADGREWDDKARTLSTVKANYGAVGGAIDLRWSDGSFVADGDPFDDLESRAAKAERVFLKLLDRFSSESRYVSSSQSPTYAPKVFVDQPDAEQCRKYDLEAAMNRLFLTGRIRNGTHRSKGQERGHIEKIDPVAFGADDGGCLV